MRPVDPAEQWFEIGGRVIPVYCAIDTTVNPGGAGNIGPWSSSNVDFSDLKMASITLFPGGGTTPSFRNFLHIQLQSSKLIDAANNDYGAYDSTNQIDILGKDTVLLKDFDDELSPIDVPGGTNINPTDNPLKIPLDIGADEFPTEPGGQGFSIWWETRQFDWSASP